MDILRCTDLVMLNYSSIWIKYRFGFTKKIKGERQKKDGRLGCTDLVLLSNISI